ncbi:MAG: transcription elongation factor GreA [Dehalococcoidia bacterium]|nr:transcription elongation factor GreA [Dehalococcoidia bacterium]
MGTEKDDKLSENLTLAEAAALYLGALDPEERKEQQHEVNRFVQWYGRGRRLSQLVPSEIGNYAEGVCSSATPEPAKKLESPKALLSYLKKQKLTDSNLSVHLKSSKAPRKKSVAHRKAQEEVVHLTPQGFAQVEAQLQALKEERPRVAEELRTAMADKDFRENAPLDAAREAQGQLEARIRALEASLKKATIISGVATNTEKTGVGSMVHIRDMTCGEEMQYKLVTPQEADPFKGKVSYASPIGKALLDKVEGEVVEVVAPVGKLKYQIVAIKKG